MPHRIATKSTLKQIEKRERRARKTRRNAERRKQPSKADLAQRTDSNSSVSVEPEPNVPAAPAQPVAIPAPPVQPVPGPVLAQPATPTAEVAEFRELHQTHWAEHERPVFMLNKPVQEFCRAANWPLERVLLPSFVDGRLPDAEASLRALEERVSRLCAQIQRPLAVMPPPPPPLQEVQQPAPESVSEPAHKIQESVALPASSQPQQPAQPSINTILRSALARRRRSILGLAGADAGKQPKNDEESVHLATSVFPTGTSDEVSADATSVHLATSVFPTGHSHEHADTEPLPLRHDHLEVIAEETASAEKLEPVDSSTLSRQKLLFRKAKSSETVPQPRPIPARRQSLSTESFPSTNDGPANFIGQLALSVIRNRQILDHILRNKDLLLKPDSAEHTESLHTIQEMTTFTNSLDEVNSKLRGLLSDSSTDKSSSLTSTSTGSSTTSFKPRWLFCRCCGVGGGALGKSLTSLRSTTSSSDATDAGSHLSLPSCPSDSVRSTSNASTQTSVEKLDKTAEKSAEDWAWSRLQLFPVVSRTNAFAEDETVPTEIQSLRLVATGCQDVSQLVHAIGLGSVSSVSGYLDLLDYICQDYIRLVHKVYLH